MFRFFTRPRAINFKARSPERDLEVDRLRAGAIFRAIEDALQAARAEHAGLTARVDEVLARAAITLGNGTDEYLTREAEDSRNQDTLGAEIANGQRRLSELTVSIGHYQFLRTALLTRFPDFNLAKTSSGSTARTTT
ncbi:hypothetical protein [Bradyrhizobium valentinum]|uniref:Uncharacterized protein n=1 Tax=Bradyrhizobium valentinum TaxID=1518501 RepID=A0A0R3M1B0_9BRAD|nr:hypothetical protein [Bradyrhizobium valentinum]KRR03116.1 hypothetical protein CP49_03985 [Bradyrhizobium valentinum]KRR14050.1 hypothetical protein CQ10_09570 [Bradyrhizobium valentinum]